MVVTLSLLLLENGADQHRVTPSHWLPASSTVGQGMAEQPRYFCVNYFSPQSQSGVFFIPVKARCRPSILFLANMLPEKHLSSCEKKQSKGADKLTIINLDNK